jgi:nicotinamidase/pyrazinamidase
MPIALDREHDALLIVDAQRGFMPGSEPGYGELPAPDGDAVAAPLAAVAARVRLVAASGDRHPPDHSSFAEQGGTWPVHCVAGTPGAELHPLVAAVVTPGWFFPKGTVREIDAYSAFAVSDIAARLHASGVRRLLIGGLVTNVCVLRTALDALAAGFEVVVLADACRAIPGEVGVPTGEEALARLRAAGATVAVSGEIEG